MRPYVLAAGEGRSYEWADIVFTMKAAAAETEGAVSIWEVTTRPGEEPHTHTHDDVHEIFFVLSGSMTVRCGDESFEVTDGGFVFLPRGVPHGYTVTSDEVRLLGFSTPSDFGDHIEQTGEPIA